MGTLYIVATPIGNLQDITLRAVEILKRIEYIACEDTRRTIILLEHFKIMHRPTLLSYFEYNEQRRIPQIITILKNGKDIALISDAGTPTISDPGFKLIRQCIQEGIRVESIPGPSSTVSSLVVSGLPTDKFLFVGYPPKKPGNRIRWYKNISKSLHVLKTTVIMFESPHKLVKTLKQLQSVFGDIHVVICRELTKVHEEKRSENLSSAIAHFEKKLPKGEFVLLFNLGEYT